MPFHHAHVLSRIQNMILCHIMPAKNGFSFTDMFVCLLVYVNVFNWFHRFKLFYLFLYITHVLFLFFIHII